MIVATLRSEKFQDIVLAGTTGEIVNYHQPFLICPSLGAHHCLRRKKWSCLKVPNRKGEISKGWSLDVGPKTRSLGQKTLNSVFLRGS